MEEPSGKQMLQKFGEIKLKISKSQKYRKVNEPFDQQLSVVFVVISAYNDFKLKSEDVRFILKL